jgi:hypothetical protein
MLVTPMTIAASYQPPPEGLHAVRTVALSPQNEHALSTALAGNGGDTAWRGRKRAEARDLLALGQIAPPGRLTVQMLDLRQNLRAMLLMRVPVPCRPDADNKLQVADWALLGLVYPREVLRESLPGPSFVQILQPQNVWHANVAPGEQILCLGDRLPCNIPAREIVLMTYGALAMTTWQVNETDEAGVLNHEAARWWAENLSLVPLSRTPFLEAEPGAPHAPKEP